jgi:hypothetical protein
MVGAIVAVPPTLPEQRQANSAPAADAWEVQAKHNGTVRDRRPLMGVGSWEATLSYQMRAWAAS